MDDEEFALFLEECLAGAGARAGDLGAPDPCAASDRHARPPDLRYTSGGDIPVGDPPRLPDDLRLTSGFAGGLEPAVGLLAWSPSDQNPGYRPPLGLNLGAKQMRVTAVISSAEALTIRAHHRTVRDFLAWCAGAGAPPRLQFPVSAELCVTWLASFTGSVSPGTITKRLSGMKLWHDLHLQPFDPNPGWVRRTLAGARAHAPAGREPCRPVRVADLKLVLTQLSLDSLANPHNEPANVAAAAAYLTAFFGMCRLGELTVPSLDGYRASSHPGGDAVLFQEDGGLLALVRLPRSKTSAAPVTVALGGVAVDGAEALNAVRALVRHMRLNNPGPGEHLFTYTERGGKGRRPLTKSWFVQRFNGILADYGEPQVTGHSFRVGGATFYTRSGQDVERVKLVGRWKSDAWMGYVRDKQRLAATALREAQAFTESTPLSLSLDGAGAALAAGALRGEADWDGATTAFRGAVTGEAEQTGGAGGEMTQ